MHRVPPLPRYNPGPRSAKTQTARGITDFLRAHDRMAALMPAVTRMAGLQKDCAALLPTIFDKCSVLLFEAGSLVLSIPNAALAAKLKQQLPKLQDGLLKRGWQVNAIRLKVQPGKIFEKPSPIKQLALPAQAISSLAQLNAELEDSQRNHALKAALATLLERHRPPGK